VPPPEQIFSENMPFSCSYIYRGTNCSEGIDSVSRQLLKKTQVYCLGTPGPPVPGTRYIYSQVPGTWYLTFLNTLSIIFYIYIIYNILRNIIYLGTGYLKVPKVPKVLKYPVVVENVDNSGFCG